jgi:Xaa-Pro aminopeptidase
MLRADDLIVVHHDDSISRFTNVRYALSRRGLRIVPADGGAEIFFPAHDVLTTRASTTHAVVSAVEVALAA